MRFSQSCSIFVFSPTLLRKTIIEGGEKYKDLLSLSPESFPRVPRLAVLYGLLGRHTPIRNPVPCSDDGSGKKPQESWLGKCCVHIGLQLIFDLYDNPHRPDLPSTLTDLNTEDIEHLPEKTLLICGTRDPLLTSNIAAKEILEKGGSHVDWHVFDTNHAFHGFPINWHAYLGSNWKDHALPAQVLLSNFLTDGAFDEQAYIRARERQAYVTDRSPLLVFPFFLSVVPVAAYIVARFCLNRAGIISN